MEDQKNQKKKPIDTKYLVIGALILFLLIGAYFRVYHLNFPVIGYHNWKETHYLTEARNFNEDGFFHNGFFVPEWDYPDLGTAMSGAHADTFPVISILVALSFKIFGESLAVARLIGIFCSLGSVYLMFIIVKKLFGRDDIAIVAAGLTAVNPMLVFFSRTVQLINPALLFMLLSWYFFLDWKETLGFKHGMLTAGFLALAGLTQYSFLLIGLPMLFTLPWKKVLADIKPNWKRYGMYVAAALPLPAWYLYSKVVAAQFSSTTVSGGIIVLDAIFKKDWWSVMKSYVADNYTMIGFALAIIGLFIVYFMRKEHFGNKFTLFYAVSALPWIVIMSDKLGQHSYHQYPLAPLIIILMSYTIVAVSTNLAGLASKGEGRNYAKYGIILLIVFLMMIPSVKAFDRQFDVQFPGLDLAGEYINGHSSPEERVIFSRGQSFGVLWHADRKGFGFTAPTTEQIIKSEEQGATWLFLYQWGLDSLSDPDTLAYMQDNYGIEQIGFLRGLDKSQLVYVLLKKGGTFTPEELNAFPTIHTLQTKTYGYTKGTLELTYVSADK